MTLVRVAARAAGRLLRPLRGGSPAAQSKDHDHAQYISFEETIAGAKAAGLSVGDFIDQHYNIAGATQRTIDEMAALGVFKEAIGAVCEIGPGSGRYLSRIVNVCRPGHYEIYETATAWANYLVNEYHVLYRTTNGRTLAETPTESVDLAQAHKVFVVTPFISTWSYLREMIRVTKRGGHIVFDIMTEPCVEPDSLDAWMGRSSGYYPSIFPRDFALEIFGCCGVTHVGSFFVPMRPGKTETFVFRK